MTKTLHNGEEVSLDTPTRVKGGARYLLTQDEIDALAINGDAAADYQAAQRITLMRDTRDMLLMGCDWTQLNDCSETPERIAAYVVYRQELKDIPQGFPDGENISWPIEP